MPDLSPELEAVVMSALEKDPARRPGSAGELSRRFDEALGLDRGTVPIAERDGAFSRISVPIGEERAVRVEGGNAPFDDEATVVRERARSRAVAPEGEREDDLFVGDDGLPGRPARYSTPARGTAYVPPGERSNTAALVIGIVALLVAAGIAGWVLFGDKLMRGSSESELVEAQQAITDSIARVESLPREHPLRTYLPQLLSWQGELRGYIQSQNFSPQAVEIAARYRQRAEDLSGQARAALTQVERDQNSNLNSAMPSPTPPPSNAAQPPLVEPVVPGDEEENANREPDEQRNENSNTRKKDKPEPPVSEPVKPSPSPEKPSNSNRPRNERPPNVERVNPSDFHSPPSGPRQ